MLLVLVAVLLPASFAAGDICVWRGEDYYGSTYTDAFSNGAYWRSTTAPGAADMAYFHSRSDGDGLPTGSETTVALDQDVTHSGLYMLYGSATVTMDLAGHTHTTTSTESTGTYFEGEGAGNTFNLINSGSAGEANWAVLSIGRGKDTVAGVHVAGATLNVTTSPDVNIGATGTGTMNLTQNATFSTQGTVRIGRNSAAVGTMTVSGADTSATIKGHLFVGSSGTGSLTVSDGAEVITTGGSYHLRVGYSAGSSGTVLVTGQNSLIKLRSEVGVGGAGSNGGQGTLTVSDGGRVECPSTFRVWQDGTLRVDGGTVDVGASLRLEDQATFSAVLQDVAAAPVSVGSHLRIGAGVSLELELEDGLTLSGGEFLPLIEYTDILYGTFDGFAEGATVQVGGQDFEFTYVGGTGKTVGLTAVPEPAVSSVLMIGAALVARRRRK